MDPLLPSWETDPGPWRNTVGRTEEYSRFRDTILEAVIQALLYIWLEYLWNRAREVFSHVIAFGLGWSQSLEIQVCHAHLNLHKEGICWSQVLAQLGTHFLCLYMSHCSSAGLPSVLSRHVRAL